LIENVGLIPDTSWEASMLQYDGHVRVPAPSSVEVRKRFRQTEANVFYQAGYCHSDLEKCTDSKKNGVKFEFNCPLMPANDSWSNK
jgi:hypothetical protein